MLEEPTGQSPAPTPVGSTDGQGKEPAAVPAANQPTEQPAAGGLPDGASDRTKEQFEKVLEHNKQLKAENDRLHQVIPSVLESTIPSASVSPGYGPGVPPQQYYQPPYQQPQYAPPSPPMQFQPQLQTKQDLVDKDGYLDVAALDKRFAFADAAVRRAQEAEVRAQQVQQEVQQVRREISHSEITRQARELHSAYPELDPTSSTFNPEAFDLVKKELLDQLVKTGRQDGLSAAGKMSKYFRSSSPAQPQPAAVAARNAATTTIGSGSKPAYASTDEYEQLRKESRKSPRAMMERIRRSGY